MKREVFEIDELGYITNKFLAKFDSEGNLLEELAENIITVQPQSFYKPQWTGMEWVESLTQEEIDAINNVPQLPTEIELMRDYVLDVDYRLVMMELGLL
nr:hypothetical protein [Sedimentibacter sp.]